MRRMRTIRERLLEGVADNMGYQLTYCDDDDVVHAIELAAEAHPMVERWWNDRITDKSAVEQDVKAVRLMAAEGRTGQHG